MPELRKDPIAGRWIIIATERAKRPSDFNMKADLPKAGSFCPFCYGNEGKTPSEITAIRDPDSVKNQQGWKVRVVPNKFPALQIEGELDRAGEGIYDKMNGIGAHEVIVESPDHTRQLADLDVEQILMVMDMYKRRMVDLKQDKRFKYILLFKNHGDAAGASMEHSHSQLIATPVTPKRVKEELSGSRQYYEYKDRCVYCDIIKQETKDGKRIVYENEHFIAFAPFASRFPFEVWALPKYHAADFADIQVGHLKALAEMVKTVLTKLKQSLNDPPYNYIIHTAPNRTARRGYWTTIEEDYHWHFEIMPRLTKVAGFEWGSGFYINPVPPENAAEYLRNIT